MTHLAAAERSALCDLALEVGPDAPTLSGDWDVRDLMCHLVVREQSPAAVGIVLSPLAGVTDRAMAALRDQDFAALVERVRRVPRWSPLRAAPLDRAVNTLEYFIHHEDVRRAVRPSRPATSRSKRRPPSGAPCAGWVVVSSGRRRSASRSRVRTVPTWPS